MQEDQPSHPPTSPPLSSPDKVSLQFATPLDQDISTRSREAYIGAQVEFTLMRRLAMDGQLADIAELCKQIFARRGGTCSAERHLVSRILFYHYFLPRLGAKRLLYWQSQAISNNGSWDKHIQAALTNGKTFESVMTRTLHEIHQMDEQ